MKCPKCGNEYSLKVYRVHKDRCNAEKEKKETVQAEAEELTKAELIELADAEGVSVDKRWSKDRIAEAINGS